MALFVSTFINKLDRKGRISVPAPFRAALAQQSFAGIVAFPSFTSTAIEGWPISFLEDMATASAETYDLFSDEQDDLNTLIFSTSHQLAFDPEGRVVLPEELIAHAGLSDLAAFVGKGRTFQIWEPEAMERHRLEARERAKTRPLRVGLKQKDGGQ